MEVPWLAPGGTHVDCRLETPLRLLCKVSMLACRVHSFDCMLGIRRNRWALEKALSLHLLFLLSYLNVYLVPLVFVFFLRRVVAERRPRRPAPRGGRGGRGGRAAAAPGAEEVQAAEPEEVEDFEGVAKEEETESAEDEAGGDGDGLVDLDPEVAAEWGAAAVVEDEQPRKLPNGQVWVGDKHVGRVTTSDSGGRPPRLFVYCRVHGCYKCIAYSKNPFMSGAVKWVAAGLRPDVTSRAQHEQLFTEIVTKP